MVETFGQEQTLEFYRSYTALPAANVRDPMPRFGSAFAAEAVFADLREKKVENYLAMLHFAYVWITFEAVGPFE